MKKVLFVLAAIVAFSACEDEKKDTVATDVVDVTDAQTATDTAQTVDPAADVSVAVDATKVEQ